VSAATTSGAAGAKPLITVLTPCFNEERNIEACVAAVRETFERSLSDYDYEHLFCDNASTDTTVQLLKAAAADDPRIKVIVNTRNIGPMRNTANGLRYVSGDLVVPFVPADIQDPPSVIPALITALGPDLDVVYGVRKDRQDPFYLAISRKLYYALVSAFGAGHTPPSHAGDFLLARRHVIDAIVASGNASGYVRGLVAQTEPRYATVEYSWGVRERGKSSNSYFDLVDQAVMGLVTTANAPVRWALPLGLLVAAAGVLFALVSLILFLVGASTPSPGVATVVLGVFLFGGLQLFILGVVGEYVVSVHRTVSPPPPVGVRERINI
jgi:glycosyltransferase involved in cell wall biosynthesis